MRNCIRRLYSKRIIRKGSVSHCIFISLILTLIQLFLVGTTTTTIESLALLPKQQHYAQKQQKQLRNLFSIQFSNDNIIKGYNQRIEADPKFLKKSIIEITLAASTQFIAEYNRRGGNNILIEIDYVLAGILTAIIGKYYSMWKTAKTKQPLSQPISTLSTTTATTTVFESNVTSTSSSSIQDQSNQNITTTTTNNNEVILFGLQIPTNAFQLYMLDGITKPNIYQRIGSLIVPMISLFRAGFIASIIGYGFIDIMTKIRTILLPSYIPQTSPVNIIYASIYTGLFVSVVSNIRYQILQGIIEPIIQHLPFYTFIHDFIILVVRIMNGYIGSFLAISGMKYFGLQRLK